VPLILLEYAGNSRKILDSSSSLNTPIAEIKILESHEASKVHIVALKGTTNS
jgi:hypothetical protein